MQVLTVGTSQYHLGAEADPGSTVVRVADGNAHNSHGSLAVIRQRLRVQVSHAALYLAVRRVNCCLRHVVSPGNG